MTTNQHIEAIPIGEGGDHLRDEWMTSDSCQCISFVPDMLNLFQSYDYRGKNQLI